MSVQPILAGWKSLPDPYGDYYGPPRVLTDDARRLDVSLAWHAAAGARPSLELLVRLGAERIAAHDLALARRFCAELGLAEPASPIVRVEVEDAERALERLERAGVRCAGRAGGLRFAFHLYNDESDVDLALEALGTMVFASEA
jgi:selenocysteine lyase/cysteine desulfurase